MGKNICLSISERFCILGQKTRSLGKILLQHAACQSVTSKGMNAQLQLQGSEALTTLTPVTALLPSKPNTECSQGAPASTAWSQSSSLQCTSVGLYNILPFVPNPACDTARLVSPMFKGMELQSMHFIEIIQNAYNPTENPEAIVWYQPWPHFNRRCTVHIIMR